MIYHALLPLITLLASSTIATPISPTPIINLSNRDLTKRFTGVRIQSSRDGKCLHAGKKSPDADYYNGLPITSYDCRYATTWNINIGSGSITVVGKSGDTWAIDAGSTPGNNGKLKLWQSYPGLYQQTWYLTDDGRIAITGGDQCMDEDEQGIPQTYRCTTGNTNQAWNIVGGPDPPASSSSSSSSTSSAPSSTPTLVDPIGEGNRIHPADRPDLCVTVMNGAVASGQNVQITQCFPNSSPDAKLQLWDIPGGRPGTQGLVKLHAYPTWCLSSRPGSPNAGAVVLQQCSQGNQDMMWARYSGVFVLGNNQCLDVQLGSTGSGTRPYPSVKTLQTWTCSIGNPQQQFYINYTS